MSQDISEWIRLHKKQIAREFVRRSGLTRSLQPTAIITAGLPGAGKTEFTQELLKLTDDKPLRIDMDEIATLIEGYRPEIADKFRIGASAIMSRIYDEVVKAQIDFVLDGTFGGKSSIANVERAITHGYRLKLYYIYQEPRIAWDFTQAREKIEHRSIDKEGFIETYFRIYENINALAKYKNLITLSLIIKDKDNKVGELKEGLSDILQLLPVKLSRIELEKALQ